jgi:hypothetical protein
LVKNLGVGGATAILRAVREEHDDDQEGQGAQGRHVWEAAPLLRMDEFPAGLVSFQEHVVKEHAGKRAATSPLALCLYALMLVGAFTIVAAVIAGVVWLFS